MKKTVLPVLIALLLFFGGSCTVAENLSDATTGVTEESTEKAPSEEATEESAGEVTSEEVPSEESTTEEATSEEVPSEEATTEEATSEEVTTEEATSEEATSEEVPSEESTTEEITEGTTQIPSVEKSEKYRVVQHGEKTYIVFEDESAFSFDPACTFLAGIEFDNFSELRETILNGALTYGEKALIIYSFPRDDFGNVIFDLYDMYVPILPDGESLYELYWCGDYYQIDFLLPNDQGGAIVCWGTDEFYEKYYQKLCVPEYTVTAMDGKASIVEGHGSSDLFFYDDGELKYLAMLDLNEVSVTDVMEDIVMVPFTEE